MTKTKNICLLIAVTLQFSAPCFSQGSQKDQSGIRIIRLINPVKILKTSGNSVKTQSSTRKSLTVINKNKPEDLACEAYNLKLIKLVNYIKYLQSNNSELNKSNQIVIADDNSVSNKNYSETAITKLLAECSDAELIKLVNHIKNLEKIKTSTASTKTPEQIESYAVVREIETLREFILREQQQMK